MKAPGFQRIRCAARVAVFALAGSASLACGGPSQEGDAASPAPGGVVLARIGDEVITTEDLGALPPKANPANRLDALVRRKLAILEARRRGLQNEPKVRADLEQIQRNAVFQEEALLRNALFNSIRVGLQVSEEDVLAHYERTKDRYVERQWALRMQGFANEEAALAALAALGATGRLDPAQSEAPGPLPADKLPPGVLPILHELTQPGQHRVVPLDRWTIVEFEAYLPAAQLPFETVRPKVELSLRAMLAEELMRAEIDRLRTEMKVTIDEGALAAFAAVQSEPPPAAPAPAAAPAP